EARLKSGQTGRVPRFMNPREEMELAKQWQGTDGPALLMSLLPEGVNFIDHTLIDSVGRSLVKDPGKGVFVSLRAHIDFNGRRLGTNMGVSAMALAHNAGQAERYLVRKDAKAAILFIHGGGT